MTNSIKLTPARHYTIKPGADGWWSISTDKDVTFTRHILPWIEAILQTSDATRPDTVLLLLSVV